MFFFVMLSAEFLVYGFSLFPSLFIRNDFTDDIREKKDDKFCNIGCIILALYVGGERPLFMFAFIF